MNLASTAIYESRSTKGRRETTLFHRQRFLKAVDRSRMRNHKVKSNGLIPNSIKFISSCIKAVSTNARSSEVSASGSFSGGSNQQKDQVLWTCFDRLELGPCSTKHVLLVGYSNGFQVFDVENASSVSELVSKRDDPVTFLQMQPIPAKLGVAEGFKASHPLLLVVAIDGSNGPLPINGGVDGLVKEPGTFMNTPTSVRFYSLRSQNYVHVLRFRSTVYMVRCSSQIVAVGLASQIYCFDALTLENKFSVLTYPIPQLGSPGFSGVNIGYGPMSVGTRWLAYASNNVLLSNTGRLSPQSLTPSPGVSPSTSPNGGSLVARYAMESSKQLASGIISLGDMGYRTLSKYYQDLTDGSSPATCQNSGWRVSRSEGNSTNQDAAGMVVVKDIISGAVVSQFRAHKSPLSALCFDHSGTLLVTASIHGHNINIFRIMPCSSKCEPGIQSFDWSSSHVHLYKLHRGVTAVIQDICFSHYSQWVAIISSKGTCHLFILSPFGGETGLHVCTSSADSCKFSLALSPPWWFTPSFSTNRQLSLPQPPDTVTLSVASRIKNGTGWLDAVNITSAANVSVPPGAIAATFHSSLPSDSHSTHFKNNTLEHLLVYSPSGYLVQHDLVASMGGGSNEAVYRTFTNSYPRREDGELQVVVEPIQSWDICRRNDWVEKEACLAGVSNNDAKSNKHYYTDKKDEDKDLTKQSYRFISNAEVQISSRRVPIWRKPEVYFHVLRPHQADGQCLDADNYGEYEIEKLPFHEIEIKRNEFASFDRLQSICSNSVGSSSPIGVTNSRPPLKHAGMESSSIANMEGMSDYAVTSGSLGAEKVVIEGSIVNIPMVTEDPFNTNIVLTSPKTIENNEVSNESCITEHGLDHAGVVQCFQKSYCNASAIDGGNDSTEAVTDADSCSSPRERDGDNDLMLGGFFAFCEEEGQPCAMRKSTMVGD